MENTSEEYELKKEEGVISESFNVPPNIKQIGMLDDRVKIYIEDYVYTYLNEFSKSGGNRERLAVLVGKHIDVQNQEIIVISGAVEGKDTVFTGDVEEFTDDSYNFINSQIDTYFKDLSIVGWMRSQPGFGAFISSRDEGFHKSCFKYSWQILYIIDPLEKMNAFYAYNAEKTAIVPARGYYIYYDKNRNMQDYMMNLKSNKEPEDEEAGDIPICERKEETKEDEDVVSKMRDIIKSKAKPSSSSEGYVFGTKTALVMLSVFLFVGLLNSMFKIKKLENDISAIKSSYGTMIQIAEGKTLASVYSPQSNDYNVNNVSSSAGESTMVSANTNNASGETEPSGASEDSAENSYDAAEAVNNETKAVLEETSPGIFKEATLPEYYVVEAGDSLEYISRKFYGDRSKMKEIMELNNIEDPDKIYFGYKIKLPH
ncbi:MAG: LysM peptidoglycan-binding domain-containing protein [Lachnospiraceae bacterium]|nr:LysM peptidoglycan-binding domain-containing protein [Lachnospiraceae bacterium]